MIKNDTSIFCEITAKGQAEQPACRWCSETRFTTLGEAVEWSGPSTQPGHRGTAAVWTCLRVQRLKFVTGSSRSLIPIFKSIVSLGWKKKVMWTFVLDVFRTKIG